MTIRWLVIAQFFLFGFLAVLLAANFWVNMPEPWNAIMGIGAIVIAVFVLMMGADLIVARRNR